MTTKTLKQLKLNSVSQDIPSLDVSTVYTDTSWTKCNACVVLCPLARIQQCFLFVLNYSYDVLTILISIADVTTDIWVIYNYKQQNKVTFFIISLTIMILTQLSYSIAFALRFLDDQWTPMSKKLLVYVLFTLPLSPFMPFIFFGSQDEISHETYIHEPPIVVWIENKWRKHMGFIMEALIEALPQSIIQLVAIVYYQDTEILNIVSICISLTSVATKTLVFSVGIDFRVFIFNWLSLVCDFFGIFVIVSWVFYNPNNPGEITFLGQIWIRKAVMVWGLGCVLIGAPMCVIAFGNIISDNLGHSHRVRVRTHGMCCLIIKSFGYFLMWVIIWILGSTFAIVLCEVLFFSPFALASWLAAHQRFVDAPTSMYAKKIFDFVLDNKSMETKGEKYLIHLSTKNPLSKKNAIEKKRARDYYSNTVGEVDKGLTLRDKRMLKTSKKEKLFRLAYANYYLGATICGFKRDNLLANYLADTNNIENSWKDVTLTELRKHCENREDVLFWTKFKKQWDKIRDECIQELNCQHRDCEGLKLFYVYFMLWVGFPLFILSRLFSMFFPIISIIYSDFDLEAVSLLQLLLSVIYGLIIVSWIVALIKCMQFYYWSNHLYPGDDSSWWRGAYRIELGLRRLNLMQKYYNLRIDGIFIEKNRIETVIDILGKDIGGLIVSYWPKFDFKQLMDQLKEEESYVHKQANNK